MDKETVDSVVRTYRRELQNGPYTHELIERMVSQLRECLYRSYGIPRED